MKTEISEQAIKATKQPACLKYIGKFTYFQMASGEITKEVGELENGDVITTENGTYIYEGARWTAAAFLDAVTVNVIDRGYAIGKGYYTVIDNVELIPMKAGVSTVVKDYKELIIKGIEMLTGAIGPLRHQALITNEETVGDVITINRNGDSFIDDSL